MIPRRRLCIALLIATLSASLGGCAETVRCPEGQVFDDDGRCKRIADGGPAPTDAD